MGLTISFGALSLESWESSSKIHEQVTAESIFAKSEKYADIISVKAKEIF